MACALAASVGDDPEKPSASAFADACFGQPPWLECFVAEHDGTLVGFVTYSRAAEAHTGRRRLWIGDVYVAPHARRRSVASDLLHAVVRRAGELDCHDIYWELWRENAAGSAFFKAAPVDVLDDLTIMRLDVNRGDQERSVDQS